jgi:molybdenum cofactor biosynthesis protein B
MAERPHEQHAAQGPATVRCCVITVSDTRSEANDASGSAIVSLLAAAGHDVTARMLVRDEVALIRDAVQRQLAADTVDVVITTGGTGITSRDCTYEVVASLTEKRLDGFGELFRMLSYQQIGPAAMMSRALAGLAAGKIILTLPGSEAAVRLAMEKLILPQLRHLVQQARK